MYVLLAGLALFIGTHIFASVRSRKPGNISQKYGIKYKAVFSLISAIGLGLLIYGYGLARVDPMWNQPVWIAPEWTRHIIIAVMPFSFILLVAADAPAGYIKKYTKHPMINGVKLWAAVHMIYNGDWPSIALFGGFLFWGSLSRTMAKIRKDEGLRRAEVSIKGDIISVVVGVALYLATVFILHDMLIGRPVLL
ncbi:NnrU family protein [Hirschia baltica]|uniref:NnrUfamily protein n=1 Tax=Hirschia baltica (strain ATCC 49814 / DSM 5838 / IFAM 1418) TaxID=582402 RepID=C6XKS4_HIRBI|nr:NnrU family protein [Hirschia baltica]ACT59641.1 NnrUfamily protein [Hirschia baltica ATCC 49814]